MSKIFINTDGGSRGNPGPAAIGVVFFDEEGKEFYSCSEYIGEGTNNEAEYRAIIKGLDVLSRSKWIADNRNEGKVICRLDSQLVVEQINGRYKIKKDHIRDFMIEIGLLLEKLAMNIEFIHIPREENKIADKLVNEALDSELKQ